MANSPSSGATMISRSRSPFVPAPDRPDEDSRLRSFGEAIDQIRRRLEAQVGEEDVEYFRRLDRFSRRMEIVGRTLLHFSFEPMTFLCGVGALWIHKQLQGEEIGHTVLHGAFDHLPYAPEYHSKTYDWDTPVDEASWEAAHVRRHHPYVNIIGRDDNIHFGFVRVNEGTPWHWYHRFQSHSLLGLSVNLSPLINFHMTGLNDLIFGSGRAGKFDFIEERSLSTGFSAFKKMMRKYVRYYAKDFVLYPLLAGPFFPKVLFGNWLVEAIRDVWITVTIFSGHVANDVAVYPEGTHARSRGEYYAMQVDATNNYEAGPWVSILSGGLDCHIEHHLFPHLPPNRLREIRSEVEQVCHAHGVRYRRERWGSLLGKTYARIRELAQPPSSRAVSSS